MEKFSGEPKIEKEKQEPRLIVDFVRHGETEYGNQVIEKIQALGQRPEGFKQMPKINKEIADEKIGMDGRLTEKGIAQLRDSAKRLIEIIDKEKELIFILFGSRNRQKESAEVIAGEFSKAEIPVHKLREHKNLIDFKNGWMGLVDFVKNVQGKENVDLEEFWWEMYKNNDTKKLINEAGQEGLHDVERRMAALVEILKRFVDIYKLNKILRVIAVTSDVNIEQVLQKDIPADKKDQIWIKNGEIAELAVFGQDQEKITRENI